MLWSTSPPWQNGLLIKTWLPMQKKGGTNSKDIGCYLTRENRKKAVIFPFAKLKENSGAK